MDIKTKLASVTLAICLCSASVAGAATVLTTSDVGYTGPTLDLSAYSNGQYNFTFGPVTLPGGITFTANPGNGGNSGMGSVIGQGTYGLAANGSFGGEATYIGVDSGTGYAELTFDAPISSFGAYWNYAPGVGDAPVISAYDALDNLLGAFDLSVLAPISTPGGFNEFAFRGIVSDFTDISRIRFGGSYILLAATANGDNPSPVPVPAAVWLFGSGLLGLVGASRRKAHNAV